MQSCRPRVLFVDDESTILNGLQLSLRKYHSIWDMIFVQSGAIALEEFKKLPFQVLVTDKMMPKMTGTELIKNINKLYPETRCIMLTGTADLKDAGELINTTRIFRFFTKPCQPEELVKGISEALDYSSDGIPPPSQDTLRRRYDLTYSEALLAHKLVLGKSLEVASIEMGITLSSSRTYLKRIFSKTGTNRQAELVSQLLLPKTDV
ncbi:MAG: DNA-binding response regulator [Candidatus Thiodiazotropha sp.]